MKKLITIMVACSLAVVVHLKIGSDVRADRIVRYLNHGILVEIDSRNVQDRLAAEADRNVESRLSKTRVFVPNNNIIKVVETD